MPRVEPACIGSDASTLSGWVPDWPAPAHVHAFMSTRAGGVSVPPFDGLNLGSHVRDDPAAVQRNRQMLAQRLGTRPVFLNQLHGNACITLSRHTPDGAAADACITHTSGLACTVMVADCLPILLTDAAGRAVAAAHAGWRGLAGLSGNGGVLAQVVKSFEALPHVVNKENAAYFVDSIAAATGGVSPPIHSDVKPDLMAWLGPCIGPTAFEVGADVRRAFTENASLSQGAADCFRPVPGTPGKYLCDLAQLARLQLAALGVTQVYGNDGSARWCTVGQPATWFSHRRDAVKQGSTGRMAACVWLD